MTAIQGVNSSFHSHIVEMYPIYCTTHRTVYPVVILASHVLCVCVCVQSLSLVQPHGLQQSRLPCPSLSPRIYSDSCPLVSDTIQPSHPPPSSSPFAFSLSPSWITALSWWRDLHNSMKLWAMPYRATQEGCVIVESSKMRPLEEGMANHSSILASRTPWTWTVCYDLGQVSHPVRH